MLSYRPPASTPKVIWSLRGRTPQFCMVARSAMTCSMVGGQPCAADVNEGSRNGVVVRGSILVVHTGTFTTNGEKRPGQAHEVNSEVDAVTRASELILVLTKTSKIGMWMSCDNARRIQHGKAAGALKRRPDGQDIALLSTVSFISDFRLGSSRGHKVTRLMPYVVHGRWEQDRRQRPRRDTSISSSPGWRSLRACRQLSTHFGAIPLNRSSN